jgi:hypothetical protein
MVATRSVRAILCFLGLSLSPAVHSALSENTKVLTPAGLLSIQHLEKNSVVVSAEDTSNLRLKQSVIVAIEQYSSRELYQLTLGQEVISCSASQQFYAKNKQQFVYASGLEIGDRLLCADGSTVLCENIKCLCEPTIFYDISLEPEHIFFIGEQGVLTHNFATIAPTLMPYAAEWLMAAGAVIARVYFGTQKADVFTDFDFGRDNILENVRCFLHQNLEWNRYDILRSSRLEKKQVLGIDVDQRFAGQSADFSQLFGPMCATARLNFDGTVQCDINSFHYKRYDGEWHYFVWERIGSKTFTRNDLLLKYFIEAKDKKLLESCGDYIAKFPKGFTDAIAVCGTGQISSTLLGVNRIYRTCGLSFGSFNFTPCALIGMVTEKISPHQIVRVFTEGRKLPSLRSCELTYIFDAISNICMVADEAGHDIIMVGRHSAMTKYNNSRPDYERDLTPVDYRSLVLACEYGLDEGKLRHINVPKHDWELVCDGSREEIERIVKEVMETGVDGIPQGNGVFVKYKLINGHFVVVLYIIHNAQRRVSTAFVCKPKLEKKYIPGRTQNENC